MCKWKEVLSEAARYLPFDRIQVSVCQPGAFKMHYKCLRKGCYRRENASLIA